MNRLLGTLMFSSVKIQREEHEQVAGHHREEHEQVSGHAHVLKHEDHRGEHEQVAGHAHVLKHEGP